MRKRLGQDVLAKIENKESPLKRTLQEFHENLELDQLKRAVNFVHEGTSTIAKLEAKLKSGSTKLKPIAKKIKDANALDRLREALLDSVKVGLEGAGRG